MDKNKKKPRVSLLSILFMISVVGIVAALMLRDNFGGSQVDKAELRVLYTATPSAAWFATHTQVPTSTPNNVPTIYALQTETRRQQVTLEANNIAMLQLQAEQENRQLAFAQMTQAVEYTAVAGTQAAAAYTATAYPTSVSLTSTAESSRATATASVYTATAYAPTLAAAFQRAEDDKRFGPLDHLGKLFLYVSLSLMAVAIPAFQFLNWRLKVKEFRQVEYSPPAPEIVPSDVKKQVEVVVRKNSETSFPSADFYTIPCTADMLSEWANAILEGSRGTGLNDWEGKKTLWTRKAYRRFRQWLVDHKLAQWGRGGTLVIPEGGDLFQILYTWVCNARLPKDYEFTNADVENHDTEVTAEMRLQFGKGMA